MFVVSVFVVSVCVRGFCVCGFCVRGFCVRGFCVRGFCVRDFCAFQLVLTTRPGGMREAIKLIILIIIERTTEIQNQF